MPRVRHFCLSWRRQGRRLRCKFIIKFIMDRIILNIAMLFHLKKKFCFSFFEFPPLKLPIRYSYINKVFACLDIFRKILLWEIFYEQSRRFYVHSRRKKSKPEQYKILEKDTPMIICGIFPSNDAHTQDSHHALMHHHEQQLGRCLKSSLAPPWPSILSVSSSVDRSPV